ncbi:MAG: MFS transporter [Treponema sp.]|jgi:DHA1 family multidrug resistance protein-like MFS transporter|nr:MFS transporter [Treponema sp.]
MKKSWKSNYTAILFAETLAMAGFALSMPVIPLFLEEDIGVRDPQTLKLWVGVIQSVAAVFLALFAPIWGHLADVYSRRMMLLRALFGGAAVISLMVFVREPWQLLVLRAIQGCLTGTIAAATVMTAAIVPAARVALALGLLQTGIAIGNSVGPMIGGVLSDFLGHRVAFLSTGLVLAAAGLIILKWVEDDGKRPRAEGTLSQTLSPAQSPVSQSPPEEQKRRGASFLPDINPILNSPVLITLMFVTFTTQAANTTASPMLPLFLKELALRGMGGDPEFIGSATGIVLGAGAAATALAAVLAGKYSTHFGYWKTLIFCLCAGTICIVPQAFVTNMIQLTVFRTMSSFFIGGTAPVLNAIIAVNADKKHQGSVYGFNSSVSSAGGALGPMIGSAAAMINYRAVFLATAFILGLSSWGTIHRQGKLRQKEGEETKNT